MMLRMGIIISVLVLTIASAWNNWEHMSAYGMGVAVLVIAAEMLKPLLPVALVHHGTNQHTTQWCGTLLLWCIIVAFSFVNTFSNAIQRHAIDTSKRGRIAASETRPEHVILKELAAVRTCPELEKFRDEKQGKRTVKVAYTVPDTDCQQTKAAEKLALTAELTKQKQREANGQDATIDKNTITDGQIALANIFGWNPRRYEVVMYTVLLWTLLAELGSALGGLCIPQSEGQRKENVKNKT
jgi:hypothetical protein